MKRNSRGTDAECQRDPRPSFLRRTLRYQTGKTAAGVLGVAGSILVYRMLGPSQAGMLQLALALAMTAGSLAGLGFHDTLARYVPEAGPAGTGLFRRALACNLLALAAVGLVFAALLGLGGLPPEVAQAPLAFFAYLAGYSLFITGTGMLRGQGRFEVLPVLEMGSNFGAKAASAVVVVVVPTFTAALGAHAAVQALVLAGTLWILRDAARAPARPFRRTQTVYAVLVLVGMLVRLLVNTTDLYVLRVMLGPEEVGIFAAGARMPRLAEQFIIAPLGVPLLYYFSHPETGHRRDEVVRRGTRVAAALVAAAALVLMTLAGPLVRLLLGEAYQASIPVVRIYAAHAVGMAMLVFTIPLYASADRFQYGIVQGTLLFAVNLALDLVLVPRWGPAGAAVAGVCAVFVVSLGAAWFLHRRFAVDLRGDALRTWLAFGAGAGAVFLGWEVAGVVGFLILVAALRLVRRDDLRLLVRGTRS